MRSGEWQEQVILGSTDHEKHLDVYSKGNWKALEDSEQELHHWLYILKGSFLLRCGNIPAFLSAIDIWAGSFFAVEGFLCIG